MTHFLCFNFLMLNKTQSMIKKNASWDFSPWDLHFPPQFSSRCNLPHVIYRLTFSSKFSDTEQIHPTQWTWKIPSDRYEIAAMREEVSSTLIRRQIVGHGMKWRRRKSRVPQKANTISLSRSWLPAIRLRTLSGKPREDIGLDKRVEKSIIWSSMSTLVCRTSFHYYYYCY